MAGSNPYPSLKDRVVIVTGGGQGLGREMALALVEHGAKVVITSVSANDERAATDAQAQTLGTGEVLALQGDVSIWDDCGRVCQRNPQPFWRRALPDQQCGARACG